VKPLRAAPLALLAALALAGCGGGDDEAAPDASAGETAAAPAATGEAPAGGCREVELPEPKPEGGREAPTALLDADREYRAVVRTNCGDFTITLDLEAAPNTTASFVALAQDDFYDGTVFHRIVPGFVIQGGDPTGTGTGGPGYTTVDTPAADTAYTVGVVAMAKTAAEAPGTAGSQFFVVTAGDVQLPPDYAVIGTVTDGLDVVQRIGLLGDPATELPTQAVVIEDVVVEE
jgi:peptidyl-prolyl cis-trans isomerase B (cyclophilin B)